MLYTGTINLMHLCVNKLYKKLEHFLQREILTSMSRLIAATVVWMNMFANEQSWE